MSPGQALAAARSAKGSIPSLPDIENKLGDATAKAKTAADELKKAEGARDKTGDPQLPPPCNTVGSPAQAQAAKEAAALAAAAVSPACKDCAAALSAAQKAKADLDGPVKALRDRFDDLDLKAKVLEDTADTADKNWPSTGAVTKCVKAVGAVWSGWPRTQANKARDLAKGAKADLDEAAAVLADQQKVLDKLQETTNQCDLAAAAAKKAKDAADEAANRLNNAVTAGLAAAAKAAMDDAAAAQNPATVADNTAAANQADLKDAWEKENAFWRAESDLAEAKTTLENELAKSVEVKVLFKAAGVGGPPGQIDSVQLYMQPTGGIPAGVTGPVVPVGALTGTIGTPLPRTVNLPGPGNTTAKIGNKNIPGGNIATAVGPPPTATVTIPTAANDHKALDDAANAYTAALAAYNVADNAATAAAGVPPPPPVKPSRRQMADQTTADADAAAAAADAARASAKKLKQMTDCAATAVAALPPGEKLANDLQAAVNAAVQTGAPGKTTAQAIKAANDAADTAYRSAAKAYEVADGSHSDGRHGADIPDDPLKVRIRTGVAPDGKPSPCTASTRFKDNETYVKTRAAAMAKILSDAGVDSVAKTKGGAPLPGNETWSARKNVGFQDATGADLPIDEGFRPRKGAEAANEARDAAAKAQASAQTADNLLLAHPTADDNGDVTAAKNAATAAQVAATAAAGFAAVDDDTNAKAQRTIAKAKAKEAADALKRAETHVGATVPAVAPAAAAPFPDTELEPLDNISGTITTVQWYPHMQRVVPAQHIPNGAKNWDQGAQTYTNPNDLTTVI